MAINLLDRYNPEELNAKLGTTVEVVGEGVSRALVVTKENLIPVMEKLCKSPEWAFDMLSDISSVDRKEAGLEVVYQLFSIKHKYDLRVKSIIPRDEAQVPTVTSIWPGANFMEREVYDLMGVAFPGHPNMTRLLLPEEFEGHPLRKDFKLQPRA
ncbi:NADH-quinone oxidoreductase subunit C [Heliobacillus mobilis]|uniref:NAD(P)H dehydrogenase subunit J n=1 Tax=Heliobacterium mobile TaxID=28064 RepID=Q0PIJ5_HELMO|nr:NADH-quinone oxidoreductase subunit C [Heliobacterium mobile]ABH04822.1 NAD(P)H-quinone oxidoreductase 27 kDa subunit [Heliobacterium mobile]MTV47696.1 NADH-quinone oxidoreductase subunit C [Heliobacterium mobile]